MRFPDSFLDEIRDRLPISEVVGSRVSFDKKKTNRSRGDFWACCPFHGEKTPSFHCEDRKGRYHCFGCGVSGDHFRFLTELDGISFPEAVERLAAMAGLPMPIIDKREREREEKRASLHDVMEMATSFFEAQLQSSGGAKARAYLRERQLSAGIQKAFRIGFAPDSRNSLKEHLAGKGVTPEQMEACGLVVSGEGIAVSYDRFRDRITFPIPDSRERIIAFGGRALSPDVPAKYLNSPETELFHKSNVLYNYARARKAVFETGKVIVAEGYMDVIAMHAAGFENAVAPLGTALTERQMLLLWRMQSEPVLCFDGDVAGLRAAHRSIDMMLPGLEPGRSARFALLPEGLDPDDLIREEGPQALREVIDKALPLAEMIWTRETSNGVFETPERRAELEARLKSVCGAIRHESLRRHYEQDMRERLAAFFAPVGNRQDGGWRSRGQAGARTPGAAGGPGMPPWKQGSGAYPGGRAGNPAGSGMQAGRSGRVAASPSLLGSSILRKGRGSVPLREALLVVGIINHPAILQRCFEEFANLPLASQQADHLRRLTLDIHATAGEAGDAVDAASLKGAIAAAGEGELVERLEGQLRHNRIWQAGIEAAFEDALDGWQQAYTLQMRAHTLHRDLRAAEAALASEDSEENLERLLQIQSEIAREDGVEALIDGFGVSSGRPGRNW